MLVLKRSAFYVRRWILSNYFEEKSALAGLKTFGKNGTENYRVGS